ncbi:MAG: DUF4836 family protein [Bacteroidaceae bacterium]|nr:DUF4836 family protein [Bacteroidaceae bacterium]
MRKKIFHITSLLIALLLCSCSNDEYRNVIPSDATAVLSIDLASMAEKSDFAHSSIKKMLDANKSLVVAGDEQDDVENIFSNPAEMGLDFTSPVYAFWQADQHIGVVFKVSDVDDVEDFVDLLHDLNFASRPRERDGVTECKLFGDILCMYDDHAFLLYVNGTMSSNDADRKLAVKLMKQGADESFVNTDAFAKMEADAADIAYYASDAILKDADKASLSPVSQFGLQPKGTGMAGRISFDDGRIVMHNSVLPLTEAASKEISEMEKHLRPIEGRYLKMDCSQAPVWACMGVDGKWLVDNVLKQNKAAKEYLFMLERCVDIEQMLRAVDGDMAVSVNPAADGAQPSISLLAHVKDTKFLDDVDYWQQSMKDYGFSMNKLSGDDYQIKLDGGKSLFWGVSDSDLYISTVGKPDWSGGNIAQDAADARECVVFVLVDWQKFVGTITYTPPLWLAFIDKVVVKMKSATELTVEVVTADKNENVLKTLMK